jgi:hypothetical protein
MRFAPTIDGSLQTISVQRRTIGDLSRDTVLDGGLELAVLLREKNQPEADLLPARKGH